LTYRIVIDGLACSGFGDCADLAPDVFEVDSHGRALLRVGTSSDPVVLEAAAACPMGAISVEGSCGGFG
jgi:ferredoxin